METPKGLKMTTELAVRKLTPDVVAMVKELAPIFKESRLFGVATDAQAASICLKGYELGLSLTASFEFITVIENKPSLIPRGALALILNSSSLAGLEIKDEVDDKGIPIACTVTMKRNNGFAYTTRFTMEDAKRAGLVKDGSGWTKYPAQMLKWRCVGFAADVVFPDILGGLKRADEFGADLTPDGNVIEGSWSNIGSQQPTSTPAVTVSHSQSAYDPARLSKLLETYGAAALMEANGGKIPGTDEELDAIEAKLGAQSE